jgi:hypothetical protein
MTSRLVKISGLFPMHRPLKQRGEKEIRTYQLRRTP